MIRIAAAVVFFQFSLNLAQAEVNLVQVPVACGPVAEINDLLHNYMPGMSNIGKGSDARGQDVAVLFTGPEHWALVATTSANLLCVVASGSNWTAAPPVPDAQF